MQADQLYGALNAVKKESMIRVEADEVTYPLHIILRCGTSSPGSKSNQTSNHASTHAACLQRKHRRVGVLTNRSPRSVIEMHGAGPVLRYELEKGLVEGTIAVADLPALWNERMASYLGCTPKDDAQGVLQDVHWSAGLFGYFPTYTLGAMYACQIYKVGLHVASTC
jgi:Zn-dependent M32 family carboxypeptidase